MKNTDWRWPNFQPEELLSPDGLELFKKRSVFKLQGFMLDHLQDYRISLEAALIINNGRSVHRGWRSHRENENVSGVADSPHIQGIAVDITAPDLKLWELFVFGVKFGWPCVIIYPKNNFCHHDCRTLIGNYQIAQNNENRKTLVITPEIKAMTFKQIFDILKRELDLPKNWSWTHE